LSSDVTSISAGSNYTCALITSGAVKCWGRNDVGQLGNGTDTGSKMPVLVAGLNDVKSISAGMNHTCALTNSGAVRCWGSNGNGELGLGSWIGPEDCFNGDCSMSPVDVCADAACTAPLSGIAAISAGESGHTCVLTDAGGVKCWGYGYRGQLGRGVLTPNSGCAWCYTTPADVCADGACSEPLSGMRAVSAGTDHSCALSAAGSVKCWGWNGEGTLGDGTSTDSFSAVDVCADEACDDALTDITAVSAGWRNTCAVTLANTIECWGTNRQGQLGIGTFTGPQKCTFACGIAPVDVPGFVVLGGSRASPPQAAAGVERPSMVRAVPDPTEISTDPAVVGTNLALAVFAVVAILFSTQLFNATINENNRDIEAFARRYIRPLGAPVRSVSAFWRRMPGSFRRVSRFAGFGAVLGGTALVYGFLEPGFSLDEDGMVLVISVVVALMTVSYCHSSVGARSLRGRFTVLTDVRVFPIALVIAIASVLISRIAQFEPGIIFGFVAGSAVVAELHIREKGRAAFQAGLGMLGLGAVVWVVLLIPAREWAKSDANVLSVGVESTAALVVVAAIQSLALSMPPATFMDGEKVWKWNRMGWVALALISAFAFITVVAFQDKSGIDAMRSHGTIAVLGAVVLCSSLAACTWALFFYRRHKLARASKVALPAPVSTGGDQPME
jgi:alpha-tubulin suppressor-like RCC1 family protein